MGLSDHGDGVHDGHGGRVIMTVTAEGHGRPEVACNAMRDGHVTVT